MASPDIKIIIPDSRSLGHDRFDQHAQIVELGSPDDSYKITEAVQGATDHDRRITHLAKIRDPFNAQGVNAIVYSEPNTDPYTDNEIPGLDRPYRIYESLTPADRDRIAER